MGQIARGARTRARGHLEFRFLLGCTNLREGSFFEPPGMVKSGQNDEGSRCLFGAFCNAPGGYTLIVFEDFCQL